MKNTYYINKQYHTLVRVTYERVTYDTPQRTYDVMDYSRRVTANRHAGSSTPARHNDVDTSNY